MTVYGLTSTGFTAKPLLTIKAELETAFQATFGQSIDVSPQSVFGQLIGIFAERESELWDAAQDVYSSFDPDGATGQSLDGVAGITGTIREPATHSTVTLTLGGTHGTVVPAGKQVSVVGTGVKFETLSAVTITGVGTFVPVASVTAQAIETGPLVGLAGTITVIETPVSGWSTVTNALDAAEGQDIETDADLRLRRENELRTASNAALEAIRTHVLAVTNLTSAKVFENISDITDGDGLPPHSIQVVTLGGAAADIRTAIFESIGAGIQTYGSISGTVTDTEGVSHTINYSTATEKQIYIICNVTKDPDEFPVDGATQIQTAVLAYGDALVMGKDVVANAITARVFSIPGVLDCTTLIGLSNPPVSSVTIPIAIRELATFDSSRLTITTVDGTP